MPQTLTVELSTHWSADTIVGTDFVGVVDRDRDRRPNGRPNSAKVIFVDSGAIVTSVGEIVGEPVGRPTPAVGDVR
jgi:hypothetical protein